MTDLPRPDDQTTIEDLPSTPAWPPSTAPIPNPPFDGGAASGASGSVVGGGGASAVGCEAPVSAG